MERLRRVLVLPILVSAGVAAGCEDGGRLGDVFAQRRSPSGPAVEAGAEDRLQQQLGEIPVALDTASAARLSGAFRAASAHALPAVVQIRTLAVSDAPSGVIPGFPPEIMPQRTQGTGSGFIFDERGHILTNNHVVRNALNVNVTLLDGREYTAEVIGTDLSTDIAVIKVEPGEQSLPVIQLGSSDNLRVGDWVIALGNPMGLTFTATAGIVSAKNRSIGILAESGAGQYALEAFIQTDAAINPGNSGGPLVDLNGRVIGINTAIESATGYFTGAGFAIPIDLARKVADDLIRHGTVHRPRLGVVIDDVSAADAEVYGLASVSGVEVRQLTPGTPADRAGLQLGDVIIALNNQPVNTVADLQARVALFQPGDRVNVSYVRYGRRGSAIVELGQFDAPEEPRQVRRPERESSPLGFRVVPLPPQFAAQAGIRGENVPVVSSVDPLGPAAGSGLDVRHIIRKFNGRDIRDIRDLERAAASVKPGQVISLIVVSVGVRDPQPMIINYRAQ